MKLPLGFRSASIAAGLKSTGALDLTLIENQGLVGQMRARDHRDLRTLIELPNMLDSCLVFHRQK